jgi:hypothetical protein
MMNYPPKKGGGGAFSEPQAWQGQVAQLPVDQGGGGYADYIGDAGAGSDFDFGAYTQPEDTSDMEYQSDFEFALPTSLEGDFGVGGGGTVDFSKFNPEEFRAIYDQLGTEDAVKNMLEGMSIGGTLDSSIAVQKTADEVARAQEEWLAKAMGMWQASQEAGLSRGLQGRIAGSGNALQKAMFEARLPMEIASSMGGLATSAQGLEMQPWNMAYEDWQRTTPEAAMGTYGNALLNLLGQEPGGPPQYEEGAASKLMGIGSSLLPFFGGGGGGGSDFSKFYSGVWDPSQIEPLGMDLFGM